MTGLAANFSPMPRIAPPPLGREIEGAAGVAEALPCRYWLRLSPSASISPWSYVVQISYPVIKLFQRLTQTGNAEVVASPIERPINPVALATRAAGSATVCM